jgi:hypothetical protein
MYSTPGDRSTKIDFFNIPEPSELAPQSLTPVQSAPPSATSRQDPPAPTSYTPPSPKRQTALTLQGHPATKHRKKTAINKSPIITGTGHKGLTLVQAAKHRVSALDSTAILQESPWNSLRSDYELNLGGFVVIASSRTETHDHFIVKRLYGDGTAEKVQMLLRVRHVNFLHVLECFNFEDSYYVVFEHVPISLAHVVKSPPYLRESELAVILRQILEGLAYLAKHNLEHGSLSCSNILLSTDGDIKITDQECCREIATGQPRLRDVRALGYIIMELMQKYTNNDGAIGLEDFSRYPSDSDAVDFLATTTSVTSVAKLLQHRLLQNKWEKESIKWLVGLASATTHTGFKYTEEKGFSSI